MAGNGVDEHLMGLFLIGEENGIPEHALYSDVGYTRTTDFVLDTSQVSAYLYMITSFIA